MRFGLRFWILLIILVGGCGDNIHLGGGQMVVSPESNLHTSESGAAVTFTVALTREPPGDVVLDLSSSNEHEGTVSPAQITITRETYKQGAAVTAMGVDDSVIDGPQHYAIHIAPHDDSAGLDAIDADIVNDDNDSAGVTVTPTSGLVTTESGLQATFTVALTAQPSADVSVPVVSTDLTEGDVNTSSLTFTSSNWNAPQTVTVTGLDDHVADGDVVYTIALAPTSSTDINFNAIDPDDVQVTNRDNDSPGILVTPTSGLITTESGGHDTYTVVLLSQPTAPVTIAVSSSRPGEAQPSPTSLTFTSVNWNAPQTVTVTGVDDHVVDGDQAFTIVNHAATSTDAGYNGIDPDDVMGTNLDDDSAGILVAPTTGLTTSEAGGQATFTIVLLSQPTADVSIALASNDTTEGTASPGSLTFTNANWNAPQTVTVTGVDDALADGNQPYTIVTAAATSMDPTYAGLDPDDVTVTNLDNDSAGFVVTPTSGLVTTEGGGTAQFSVALQSQPLAPVTISVASSDTTEGTVAISSLTFTPTNWNAPQFVTVTGVDDHLVDGNQPYTIVLGAATSTDLTYAGRNPSDVSVTNLDNDTAGVIVTPISGLVTTEAGGQATFTVVLQSQPSANVTIPVASSDPAEGTVSTSLLTFTSANWNAPQTVTVTGVDDFIADGNQPYTIVLSPASSADSAFAGLDPADVSVTNLDNDTAGILVTPTSGLVTTEAGGTDTFTIVLLSQPTANVSVTLTSSKPAEGRATPATVTFTTLNWNSPQVITVTGQNDSVVDGNQTYTIITHPATSTDASYNGIDPADVSCTNLDNDTAGILVTPTSGLITTESGGTADFTVQLLSQPTANVTIPVATSDSTEGIPSTTLLTFTPADWNAAQTVTVTGQNDAIADGNQPYTIVLGAATSSDAGYNGLDPSDVSVTNLDNDSAGILVTPTAGLVTTEAGGQDFFSIVLLSQPTANVTIGLSSSDTTEGDAFPSTVTFTPANWNVPQTITVTGIADMVQDGNKVYSIITAPAVSGDAGYNGLDAANVTVTNIDLDVAGFTVDPTSGLLTSEFGDTDTFTVVLNTKPTANVTISLTSSDLTEGTVSPPALTFTPTNWNVPQTVTVKGVDDPIADGNIDYKIITGAAVSTDPAYNGIDPPDVDCTNIDNETKQVFVKARKKLFTSESGTSVTYKVRLTVAPTAQVLCPVSSSDTGEDTVSPTMLTFTPTAFGFLTVTVTGVPDGIHDGNQVITIVDGMCTSADSGYNGQDPRDVTVVNRDIN